MSEKTIDISKISENDKEMAEIMVALCNYIESTYSDKYASFDEEIDGNDILFDDELGKGFNTGNSLKYIKRYRTTGFPKSENPQDLYKAIHYLIFELARLQKQ